MLLQEVPEFRAAQSVLRTTGKLDGDARVAIQLMEVAIDLIREVQTAALAGDAA